MAMRNLFGKDKDFYLMDDPSLFYNSTRKDFWFTFFLMELFVAMAIFSEFVFAYHIFVKNDHVIIYAVLFSAGILLLFLGILLQLDLIKILKYRSKYYKG